MIKGVAAPTETLQTAVFKAYRVGVECRCQICHSADSAFIVARDVCPTSSAVALETSIVHVHVYIYVYIQSKLLMCESVCAGVYTSYIDTCMYITSCSIMYRVLMISTALLFYL